MSECCALEDLRSQGREKIASLLWSLTSKSSQVTPPDCMSQQLLLLFPPEVRIIFSPVARTGPCWRRRVVSVTTSSEHLSCGVCSADPAMRAQLSCPPTSWLPALIQSMASAAPCYVGPQVARVWSVTCSAALPRAGEKSLLPLSCFWAFVPAHIGVQCQKAEPWPFTVLCGCREAWTGANIFAALFIC